MFDLWLGSRLITWGMASQPARCIDPRIDDGWPVVIESTAEARAVAHSAGAVKQYRTAGFSLKEHKG